MEYPLLPRYNFFIDTFLKTCKLIILILTILFFISLPVLLFQARLSYSWHMGFEASVEQAIEERVAPLEARIEELELAVDNSN